MSSPEKTCHLPKYSDLWFETQAARRWLVHAVRHKTRGEAFCNMFEGTFKIQCHLAAQECIRQKAAEDAKLIQIDGRFYRPSPSSKIDSVKRYLSEIPDWEEFFYLLPLEDFPNGKYLKKNKEEVLRILALNILHPDPLNPDTLRKKREN